MPIIFTMIISFLFKTAIHAYCGNLENAEMHKE